MKSKRTSARKHCKEPTLLHGSILDQRLITDAACEELTGLTRKQRLRLEKAQQFPLPIRITNKIRLYPAAQVTRWIEQRSAAADGEAA
jgi:predicted DNA-binding transcriptional regulator AlpA